MKKKKKKWWEFWTKKENKEEYNPDRFTLDKFLNRLCCLLGWHNWWERSDKGYLYCSDCGKRKYYIEKEE